MEEKAKKEIAREYSLLAVVEAAGYHIIEGGTDCYLEEMDSLHLNDKVWYRFSTGEGGDAVLFLETFKGMTYPEAVEYICNLYEANPTPDVTRHAGKKHSRFKEVKFVLPIANKTNENAVRYLKYKRCLSDKVIEYFLEHNLLYEDVMNNCVFKGYDAEGTCRFASRRGTLDKPGEKPFKKDVYGNDKHYGVNTVNDESNVVCVFEAVIDLMSYMDLYKNFESNKIALGGLSDKPLETFLSEHPNVDSIKFCLDMDKPGRDACEKYAEKYRELGYRVKIMEIPDSECKDYNAWLVKRRTK